MKPPENPRKVYVAVKARFSESGVIVPMEITWENGETFEIDRISDVRQAHAVYAGGTGSRYTVWVRGRKSYLFFESSIALGSGAFGRWFVERKTL